MVDDYVSFGEEEPITKVEEVKKEKKPRKKRVKVEVSELDESIVRELKKNRVNSKVTKSDIFQQDDTEKLIYITEKVKELDVNNLTDDIIYIYILDKLYENNTLSFLHLTPDAFSIVVNNSIVYNDLRIQKYNLSNKTRLYFYDETNGLLEHGE